MFEVPVESTYVWLGLALVGAATLGTALKLPTGPPPDAASVAQTVDSVASSPHEATAEHPLDADAIRIGSDQVGLRGPGGEAHATLAYGPVVPVFGADRLGAVLRGRPPERLYDSEAAFAAAIEPNRTDRPTWTDAPSRLLVRRVTWGDANATLVGA